MNQSGEMGSTTTTSVAPTDPRLSSHFMRPLASSSPRATVRLNGSQVSATNGSGEPPAKSPRVGPGGTRLDTSTTTINTTITTAATTTPSKPAMDHDGSPDNEVEFIGQLVGGSPKKAPNAASAHNTQAASQDTPQQQQPRPSAGSPQVLTAAQAALAQQQRQPAGGRPTIRLKSRPKKNATVAATSATQPGGSADSVAGGAGGDSGGVSSTAPQPPTPAPSSPPKGAAADPVKGAGAGAELAAPSEPAAAPSPAGTPQKRPPPPPPPQSPVVAQNISNNNNNNNSISGTPNGVGGGGRAATGATPRPANAPTASPAAAAAANQSPRTPGQPPKTSAATGTSTSTSTANGHGLSNMAPAGTPQPFLWAKYLELQPAPTAPPEAFMQHQELLENKFELGMKLVAKDPRNSSSWCLASVVNVLGLRVRLRFDGSDSMNDFFELVDSDNIRPYGTSPDQLLYPPVAFKGNMATYPKFVEKQLIKEGVRLAPADIFVAAPRRPERNLFQCGMKLEAIDRKNAFLICPATVGEVQGDDIKILFDGWRGSFDYTCKYYSREIFPVNWCLRTNHAIAPPNNWDALLLGTGDITTGTTKKVSPNKTNNSKTSPPSASKDNHQQQIKSPIGHQKPHTQPATNKQQHVKQHHQQAQHQLLDLNDLPKFSCQRAVPYCEWLKSKQSLSQVTDEDDSFTVSESTSFASTFASASITSQPQQNEATLTTPSSNQELSSSTTSTQSSPERETKPHRGRPTKRMKVEQQLREQQQYQQQVHIPRQQQEQTELLKESQATVTSPPPQQQQPHPQPQTPQTKPATSQKASTTNFQRRQMKPADSVACRGCSGFVASVEDVVDLIESDESLAKYSKIFQQHEIDGKAFCLLTTDIMINHLGLKIGPVLKINSLIEQVKCHHRHIPSNINQSL